jgi:asparagine synthase (glutamine-hydrolysing)
VKVALSGDGGDEMLAGYRRYRFDLREAAMRAIAPGWLRRSTFGAAGWLYPKADWLPRPLRAKATLRNLASDDISAHLRSVSLCAGMLPAALLKPELQADGYDPYTRGRDTFMRCSSSQLLNRLLYVDMKTLMVDEILTKVDRASMAVGLEVRVPLLDHRVVELAGCMPTSMKLNGSRDKHVLRETLDRWTQPGVSDRPKRGFDMPLDAWFRGPLRELADDLLLSNDACCSEWIETGSVQRLMREHASRLRNNGGVLWTLLSLEMWARTYARPKTLGITPADELCMMCT